jgi:group I intron endonuclease
MLIYLIRNRLNGRGYVGQTTQTLDARWWGHCRGAKCRHAEGIDGAIRKYGADNFERSVIAEVATLDELNAAEEFHIQAQNTLTPAGYNIMRGGNNHRLPEETKQKIRNARLGYVVSAETKAKIAATLTGKKQSAETVAKRVAKNAGRKRSAEFCAQMRQRALGNQHRLGTPQSAETREKMRAVIAHRPPAVEAARRAAIGRQNRIKLLGNHNWRGTGKKEATCC